jgi:hypothetical protein
MHKKVILLMPLTYNNGEPVPREVRDAIYSELYELCGGLTVVGKVHGAFRMADGTKQEDVLEQVWLAINDADLPSLRSVVSRIAKTLHQEKMYLEIAEARIELLPPLTEEGFQS